MLEDFHFLRPWWLLFIPYALWVHWRLRRAYSASLQWQQAIDPELLEHLTVQGASRRRLRPYQLMTLLLGLMAIVVAGPAWERQVTPFTQDEAPLVVAIELTPSMLATDVQPSRLERARHKLRDLLARRQGARTAVVGYAGSAHLLLPFTDDTELLEVYVASLHPGLMPVAGDEPQKALDLAAEVLAAEPVAGTVAFLTDGIDAGRADAFRAFAEDTGDQLLFLRFGGEDGGPLDLEGFESDVWGQVPALGPPVDEAGIEAAASAGAGTVIASTLEDGDVVALVRRIHRHLVDATQDDEALAWKDAGAPLVWAVAACLLVWFRRGWTVQWRL